MVERTLITQSQMRRQRGIKYGLGSEGTERGKGLLRGQGPRKEGRDCSADRVRKICDSDDHVFEWVHCWALMHDLGATHSNTHRGTTRRGPEYWNVKQPAASHRRDGPSACFWLENGGALHTARGLCGTVGGGAGGLGWGAVGGEG